MNGLILVVFALCVAGSSAFTYNYDFVVHFKKSGFEEQHGSITSLKFKSGLISRKTQVVTDGDHGSLPTEQKLAPGGQVRGVASLEKESTEKTRSIVFEWESDNPNAGPILVDYIVFIPKGMSQQVTSKFTKEFCYDKPIESGKPVSFTDKC
jgi:hypothetical protein